MQCLNVLTKWIIFPKKNHRELFHLNYLQPQLFESALPEWYDAGDPLHLKDCGVKVSHPGLV